MSGGNLIKESNLELLRNILRRERTATKSRLSELSGLSVVTIQSLVKTLLEQEEILEDEIVQPHLGRPAASFRYNASARLALIISMYEQQGLDTAEYMVYDLYGECLQRRQESIPQVSVESFQDIIQEFLSAYPQISVIGIGLPVLELEGKLVISDYKQLQNVELGAYYERKFQLPVFVENDINAAVLGYCTSQNYPEDKDFYIAGLYIPSKYPSGAGFCHNFEILKGKNGLAGELKPFPFDINWDTYSTNPKELEDFTWKTVQVMMCLYNPEKIVIYHEKMTPDLPEKMKCFCTTDIQKLMFPEIEIKESLKDDFNAGLVRLALERIL